MAESAMPVHGSKLLRLRHAVSAIHDELPTAPDERCGRADDALRVVLIEIDSCLSPELMAELDGLVAPLVHPERSSGELRVAAAQLLGWVDALLHELQPEDSAPSSP